MKLPQPVKPNKAVKKVFTEARRKERDLMRKRERQRTDQMKEAARQWRVHEEEKNNPAKIKARIYNRFNDSLMKGLREQLESHMTLFGLEKHPLHFDANLVGEFPLDAKTDFRAIFLSLNQDMFPNPFGLSEDRMRYVMAVKGAFHHEAGHIVHTLPFKDLTEAWAEQVQLGDPICRKQTHEFVTKVPTPAKSHRHGVYGHLNNVWNMLEDQRMESKRVLDFPAAKRYLVHLTGEFLMGEGPSETAWLIMAGRLFLPEDVRQACADAFALDPDEWETIVKRYKAADSTKALMSAVIDAWLYLFDNSIDPDSLPMPGGEHTSDTPPTGTPRTADNQAAENAVKDGEEDEGGGEGGKDTFPGDKAGEDKGKREGKGGQPAESKGKGDDKGDPTPPEHNTLDAGRGERKPTFSKEEFKNVVKQMVNAPGLADKALMQEVLTDAEGDGLFDYGNTGGSTTAMNPSEVSSANSMVAGIESALQVFVTANQPHWMERQEDGILEALEYRTREAGALDYRRWFNGEEGDGFDIHVSVLADVSYSMYPHMSQLCVSLYAMKMACENLNIDSTFSLWSDGEQNYRIFEGGATPEVFPAMGGTNPTGAFNDMLLHNVNDHEDHLVFIFTDGAWQGVSSVSRWRTSPNQKFVMVKYGGGGFVHDVDDVFDIKNLNELPGLMESTLESIMSDKV